MKHLSSWRHESGNARLYISLLWLAPLVLNSLHPPARSAQARSCRSRGVWRSKTSALTLEFALQKSTFPSSRLFQLPQGLAANYKNLFLCRHAEEQGMGWGGGISGGNSQVKPLKYETVKKTGRRKNESEREDFLTLELNSETVALRRNLIRGPEHNVSVLKKPGYCWKDV